MTCIAQNQIIASNHTQDINKPKQIIGGQWSCQDKGESLDAPKPRYNHCSFIYKDKLYIHGGSSISSVLVDDQLHDLHCFCFSNKTWTKLQTKSSSKQFELLTNYAWTFIYNKLYIFGGINSDQVCKNKLWRLNLDTLEWIKVEQSGQVPSARQLASMHVYNKNWITLYGGINRNTLQIYNTFYFLCLQNKTWFKCEGNYQHFLHPRCQPATCIHKEMIYLFGGQYRDLQVKQKYLNDLYKVEVTIVDIETSPKISISRVMANDEPPGRSGHVMLPIAQNYLMIVGGQKKWSDEPQTTKNPKLETLDDIWIFSVQHNQWFKLVVSGLFFKNRTAFTASSFKQCLYIFGGLMNYKKVLNDVMMLSLTDVNLDDQISKIPKLSCKMCQQSDNQMFLRQLPISGEFIDEMLSEIEFPFAAIGLLMDNSYLMGSSYFSINLESENNHYYYMIEDNAKTWNNEQLKSTLLNFQSNLSIMQGIDKKIRYRLQKENQRRQFGCNIKLGALRLGNELLYLSNFNNEQMRVLLIRKKQTNNLKYYESYFYVYELGSDKLLMGTLEIREKVEKQYQKYINKYINSKKVCNILFIFKLKTIQENHILQIRPNLQNNDLIYGDQKLIASLERRNILMCQCIDVSLRAYISSLFIKNDTMSIYLGVLGESHQILTQIYLANIDRLCKSNLIMEVQNVINFDCKIIQLYWNPDLSRQTNSFHNGVLLYHKNRLITRYKYPLGDLIPLKIHKINKCFNFVQLFGYIELPDALPVNIYKIDFIFNTLLEKLHQRLIFITKSLKLNPNKFKPNQVNPKNQKKLLPKFIAQKASLQKKSEQLKKNEQCDVIIESHSKDDC